MARSRWRHSPKRNVAQHEITTRLNPVRIRMGMTRLAHTHHQPKDDVAAYLLAMAGKMTMVMLVYTHH